MEIIYIVLALIVFIFIMKSFVIVRQSECVLIETLGKYSRTLTSGLSFMIPIVENQRAVYWVFNGRPFLGTRLDLRETVLDVPEQAVITRDNVSINIDALLYVQITDPVKAALEISNLPLAVTQLAQTSLRNVIGEMDLDQTLGSRDIINTKLKLILDEATDKWGTKVNRVEIKNITPPREIQVAMEKQMQAERERRAKVLEADGDRQARITRSEGQKQEQINLAVGEKEARIQSAEGEAVAILKVAEAKKEAITQIKSAFGSSELAAKYLVSSNYIEVLGDLQTGKGDKIFIPYEAASSLGALGSIKELLNSSPSVESPKRSPNN